MRFPRHDIRVKRSGRSGTSDRLACWQPVVNGRWTITAAAALLALAAPAPASAARQKAPELTRIRCVPATTATCKAADQGDDRAASCSSRVSASTRGCASRSAGRAARWPPSSTTRGSATSRACLPGTKAGIGLGDDLRQGRPALERPQDHGHRPAQGRRRARRPAGHAARGLQGQRDVDLGGGPLRGRRPGRDRRPRPLGRHVDRVRQELRRRVEPLGAVQPRRSCRR